MKTLVIGRSPFADVVIADASVAPHHAELVLTDDGRCYLTDCATETGTWRRAATTAADWVRVRQDFVDPREPLRLGDYRCTAAELTAGVRAGSPAARHEAGDAAPIEGHRRRLRGRVERDAATGEIVRRRP